MSKYGYIFIAIFPDLKCWGGGTLKVRRSSNRYAFISLIMVILLHIFLFLKSSFVNSFPSAFRPDMADTYFFENWSYFFKAFLKIQISLKKMLGFVDVIISLLLGFLVPDSHVKKKQSLPNALLVRLNDFILYYGGSES